MASKILFLAFLAEGKIQMGSRLIAACTNPQNSQSISAPNVILRGSTEADLDTFLMAHQSRDGFAVNATTASAQKITEENNYKKSYTGN